MKCCITFGWAVDLNQENILFFEKYLDQKEPQVLFNTDIKDPIYKLLIEYNTKIFFDYNFFYIGNNSIFIKIIDQYYEDGTGKDENDWKVDFQHIENTTFSNAEKIFGKITPKLSLKYQYQR